MKMANGMEHDMHGMDGMEHDVHGMDHSMHDRSAMEHADAPAVRKNCQALALYIERHRERQQTTYSFDSALLQKFSRGKAT